MIIDGKKVAQGILDSLTSKIALIPHRKPSLAFIQVGNNPASTTYVRMKKKACAQVGITIFETQFEKTITQKELIDKITEYNENPAVDGILIQLPLPEHIQEITVLSAISPEKDVDGFHPLNLGKLMIGDTSGFIPCTPKGILTLLASYDIPIAGKEVVIVGRSNIVGKPLANLLLQKNPYANATVTIAHSHTKNLSDITKRADILISATGTPGSITREMVKHNSVVIDVGISRINGTEIVGDVLFEDVEPIVSYITPVPKGVGPMTIASLLENTYLSYTRK